MTDRPLIEVAREMLDSRDAELDAARRKEDALANGGAYGLAGFRAAELVIQGYDARCAEEAYRFTDTLTLANQRIAELEAQLAASPAAQGVVVDDAMVERYERVWYGCDNIRGNASFVKKCLTAALTSATSVALASAEPEWHIVGATPVPFYRGIAEVRDGE